MTAIAPDRIGPGPRRWIYGWRRMVLAGLIALSAMPACRAAERWSDLSETLFRNYDLGDTYHIASSLAEDGDGYIWVGRQGSLTRWDGYGFRTYLPNPGDPGALPDSVIIALHADARGRLWVGTAAGGLARYDRDTDHFIVYGAGPNGLAHPGIGSIADDGAGGLWVVTGGDLDHLDPDTGRVEHLHHAAEDPTTPPGGVIQVVFRDHRGALWVGTSTGLARREPESSRFIPVVLPVPSGQPASVATVFEEESGRIWIGTRRNGAYSLDAPNAEPRAVIETGAAGSTLQGEWVHSIVATGSGEIWLGTFDGGIVAVDGTTRQTRRIRRDAKLRDTLPRDGVWALLRDRAGLIWVGGLGGLSRAAIGNGAIATIYGTSSRTGGLSGTDVYSVLAAADGRIWLGYITGGIDRIDPDTGHVDSLRPNADHPDSALPKAPVTAIVPIGNATYIGTYRGLFRIDASGQTPVRIAAAEHDGQSTVSSLLSDPGGLWVGTQRDGVWRLTLDGAAGPAVGAPDPGRLTDPRVDALAHGAGHDLWIATQNGLNRFDTASGVIEPILPAPADATALPSGFVSTLLFDRQGRLWVGTLGGGIAVLTGRDPAGKPLFRRLSTPEGLPGTKTCKLLQAPDGKIWVSTDNGLAVIDPISFAIRRVGKADGLGIIGYWVNAGAVTPQGEVLFGGVDGLSVIRPDRVTDWTYRPPVVVTDLRAGGLSLAGGRFNGSGSTIPLIVEPGANSLAVEFAALDYSAPERNRYAYWLDGYDTDWVATPWTRRLAAYTNLPPGAYTLRLRGSNREGVWSETQLRLPIQVLPAWYQTVWFRLLVGLAAITAFLILLQSRTAYLRRRQRELEGQVADRTAELRQSLNDLSATQAQLVQQEKMAALGQLTAGIAHEIQNPLNFVNNFAELSHELLEELAEFGPHQPDETDIIEMLRENMRTISGHGQRAAGIVRGMLAHSRAGSGQLAATDLAGILRQSFTQVTDSGIGRDHAAGVAVIWQIAADLPKPVIDSAEIGTVFANLIRNALYALHSRKRVSGADYRPVLTLTARPAGRAIQILVHDNGTGIPEAFQPKLFTPFFTTKPTGEGSTGLGLSLSFDIIVKRYRGELTIRSVEGEFTEAAITVPIGV